MCQGPSTNGFGVRTFCLSSLLAPLGKWVISKFSTRFSHAVPWDEVEVEVQRRPKLGNDSVIFRVGGVGWNSARVPARIKRKFLAVVCLEFCHCRKEDYHKYS